MTNRILQLVLTVIGLFLTIALGFDPLAPDNVAVYFGHSTGNFNASLPAVCNSSSVDIVILGFIRAFNGSNLPTFDIVKGCQTSTLNPQVVPQCSALAGQITACQAAGKKVFLSVGGATSNTSFNSTNDAYQAAQTLWSLFASGNGTVSGAPLGSVTVDGFDIDHEQGTSTYYDTFVSTLRSLYSTGQKNYYISVSPSCANNTIVYPSNFYSYVHFVWPRFYNAQACNTASPNFVASLIDWDQQLNTQVGSSLFPRLYIGALDFNSSEANNGFLQPYDFTDLVSSVSCCVSDRFGGVALWDGTNGLQTMENGQNFLDITKEALTGQAYGGAAEEMNFSPAFQLF